MVSPKIRVLPSGTLSETLGLRKFGHDTPTDGERDINKRQRSV